MKDFLLNILKLIGKLLLIALWGCCRLAELLLQQINLFLQFLITKPTNTRTK